MLNPFRRLGAWMYSKRVLPYTNTGTGMLFFGTGDLIVQSVVEGKRITERDQIDWKRVGVSIMAGTYMGFLGHHWYGFLDRRFPGVASGAIRRKLACEAAVGPPFAASMFLLVGGLEGKSPATIWANTKENIGLLLLADWGFYIPLQYFNFHYLPPQYRVLYVALISLVYDSALVYLLHKDEITSSQKLKAAASTK
ncbi:hypothetical protein TYRP_020279 [Tyrophagus putrescentiae]|nr:hypothetical protein TYRP_020279 [Tyrophagus putrescentiae]